MVEKNNILESCLKNWCLVSHQKIRGWLSKEFIWGVYETEVYNQSLFQPIINQYWKVLDSKFFNQIKISLVAGAAGFEPANVDSKNRCLTAWRRPKKKTLYNIYMK